ncbi:MAG: mannitol dehydrogenase family protein [Bifidobacteriaceae bacterium]|nr:mannitol dehydrogenase family protein [Bifidobacteriaceae bacterium]
MITLNQAALGGPTNQLAGAVELPQYDRSQVKPGWAHFGVGGFHRAHQAFYLDEVMNRGESLDFGIIGVGLMPSDAKMRDVMAAQDCLYTLVTKSSDGVWAPRVIGSVIGYLYGPDNPEAVVRQLADPAIRIVSLTITEGGYNFDQVTGEFIASNPAIQAELAPGAAPTTVFGYIYEALCRRRERGEAPFTIMCCDNIQDNGAVVKRALTSYAALRDQGMADWIGQAVAFPSSMVDRITPQTTDQDRRDVAERFGIEDGWPVVAESFTQWALTDWFPLGRPRFEDAGVQVVADVVPYELMKLRLLNASHQGIAYLAYLAGYRYVHDAARDPDMARFLLAYMDSEATPTLRPVEGVDLAAYKRELISRFSNAEVRDTVARLAAEGSDRIPKWLVPLMNEQLAQGGDIRRSAAICAAWARYCEGVDEQGAAISIVDNALEQVTAAAKAQAGDPLAFARQKTFFGDLADRPEFAEPYLWALDSLHRVGAAATLKALAELT